MTAGSASGFTMSFTDADGVRAYLPSIGAFAPLNGSSLNPISTGSGGLGGEVVGLKLNVDFSDAGLLPGSSGLRFGDLVLENFSIEPVFNGLTVRQFFGDVQKPMYSLGRNRRNVFPSRAYPSDGACAGLHNRGRYAMTKAGRTPQIKSEGDTKC